MNAKQYKASIQGHRNRAAGELWENIINASCEYYSSIGKAEIEKTPEPMKPIQPIGEGKFIARFEKRAQPDYKGTLAGGRAIVLEAKHTDADRLKKEAVTGEQEKRLNKHELLGAECFVLVSFGFHQFFKIPWASYKSMKEIFGRKYIKPDDLDLQKYKIYYIGGVLRFLTKGEHNGSEISQMEKTTQI